MSDQHNISTDAVSAFDAMRDHQRAMGWTGSPSDTAPIAADTFVELSGFLDERPEDAMSAAPSHYEDTLADSDLSKMTISQLVKKWAKADAGAGIGLEGTTDAEDATNVQDVVEELLARVLSKTRETADEKRQSLIGLLDRKNEILSGNQQLTSAQQEVVERDREILQVMLSEHLDTTEPVETNIADEAVAAERKHADSVQVPFPPAVEDLFADFQKNAEEDEPATDVITRNFGTVAITEPRVAAEPLVPTVVESEPTVEAQPRITHPEQLPSYEDMLPGPDDVLVLQVGNVELRQSSTEHHQDGVAYNPETETVVVCDVAGGEGKDRDIKNYFGYALAHAAAMLVDIRDLTDPEVANLVVQDAVRILEARGISFDSPESAGEMVYSTLAAVQRDPEVANRWRVVTFGDSSVVMLDKNGKAMPEFGFGEAFQLINQGEYSVTEKKSIFQTVDTLSMKQANSSPLVSAIALDTILKTGYAYYNLPAPVSNLHASFDVIDVPEGHTLVLASDAYVQKTPVHVLEREVQMSLEEWYDIGPNHQDDTTLAIIRN